MFSIGDVILGFIFLILLMYWWRIAEQKAFAVNNAKNYCRLRKVQLLDQTLVFKKFRLEKFNGKRKLCRVYEFDFSHNGVDRYKGEIILNGFNFIRVILAMDELEITEY